MGNERKMQYTGSALQTAMACAAVFRVDQLIQALSKVTGVGSEQLKMMLAQRMHDNRGDGFAALVDFLDDCMKIKKNERRTQR